MERRIIKARASLILRAPFFGALALRLKLVERTDLPTMAVDGVHLFYNAAFVAALSDDALRGVVAHEVLHVANAHHARRGGREPKLWNIACDYAINALLLDDGFTLPAGRLHDPRFAGLAAEGVYAILLREGGAATDGAASAADPGGCGGVLDAPASDGLASASPDDLRRAERDWTVAALQAAQAAKAAGALSGGAERLIGALREPVIDWRATLRDFVRAQERRDYDWSRPNRRFIADGLYLPALRSEAMGEIVIAIDASGSVDDGELARFGAEIAAIIEDCRPAAAHLLYCDSAITHAERVTPDDLPLTLRAIGGGGTDFRPPFAWVETQGLEPACLIYLTDLCSRRLPEPPPYPVIWAATSDRPAPFGEVVRIGPD